MDTTGALLCLFSFLLVGTKCDDNDEGIYALKITDSIFSCDGFHNDLVDCSELELTHKGEEDEAKLCGKIVTSGEITCEHDVEIDIWKIMDMGDEYMYNMILNFGSSLRDPDAPWYPVLQTLDIKECPVPSSVFEIADLKISLNSVKDVLTHDFVGDYSVNISLMDRMMTKVSCHTLYISIIEVVD